MRMSGTTPTTVSQGLLLSAPPKRTCRPSGELSGKNRSEKLWLTTATRSSSRLSSRVNSLPWRTGTSSARFNRIEVALDEPCDEVVLTYNWIEGLQASDGVELFRYETDEDIGLIGVRPGPAQRFEIAYRNLF